jgi:nicotinamidase/pyrazinamidase
MKLLFWDVDTQYDFMRNDANHQGALAIPEASSIEPNLARLLEFARQHNIIIVHTRDAHTPDSPELSPAPDFQYTFPPHCMQGTKGVESVPATKPLNAVTLAWDRPLENNHIEPAAEYLLTKDRFDCFAGTPHAEPLLQMLAPDKIIVFGVATNVCVDFAVRGLLSRGFAVAIVTDAIKELPNLPVEPVLAKWWELGALPVTTDSVVEAGG